MHIYETRTHDKPFCVNSLLCVTIVQLSYLCYSAVLDRYVALEPRVTGAADNSAIGNQNIEQFSSPLAGVAATNI